MDVMLMMMKIQVNMKIMMRMTTNLAMWRIKMVQNKINMKLMITLMMLMTNMVTRRMKMLRKRMTL